MASLSASDSSSSPMVLDVWCVGDSEESPETDGVMTGSVAPLAAVSAAAAAAL